MSVVDLPNCLASNGIVSDTLKKSQASIVPANEKKERSATSSREVKLDEEGKTHRRSCRKRRESKRRSDSPSSFLERIETSTTHNPLAYMSHAAERSQEQEKSQKGSPVEVEISSRLVTNRKGSSTCFERKKGPRVRIETILCSLSPSQQQSRSTHAKI